jgi:hypothetical protein
MRYVGVFFLLSVFEAFFFTNYPVISILVFTRMRPGMIMN